MDDALPARGPSADDPITDDDRKFAMDRVHYALARDELAFDELDERFEAIWRATNRGKLDAAVSDLSAEAPPPPPVSARHLAPANSFALIGDVKIGGWLAVGPVITANVLFGDIVIDVSSVEIPDDGLTVNARTVVGDTKIILPDGARVQANSFRLIGDRKEVIVEPNSGGPLITINAYAVLGDTKVYSFSAIPEGKLRRAWAAFRSETKKRLGS